MKYHSSFAAYCALGCLALVITLLPNTTSAAVPGFTGPEQYLVEDKLMVFTFTDTFAIGDREIAAPSLGSSTEQPGRFGYELTYQGEAATVPHIGFVVSEQPLRNGYYTFGPDERATFTAIIIAPLPTADASPDDFSVELTDWPLASIE